MSRSFELDFVKNGRKKQFLRKDTTKDVFNFITSGSIEPERFTAFISSEHIFVNSRDDQSLCLGSFGVTQSMVIEVIWPNEPKDQAKIGKNKIIRNVALGAGAAVVGAAIAVAAAPAALFAAGFTASGIASGSLAASMMSTAAIANGGGVAAGSLVSLLQSAGVLGFGLAANAGIGAAGAAIGGGIAGAVNILRKPEELDGEKKFDLKIANRGSKIFCETDKVKDLLDFVKRQVDETDREKDFVIILPLDAKELHSENCTHTVSLQDIGIKKDSYVIVEWRKENGKNDQKGQHHGNAQPVECGTIKDILLKWQRDTIDLTNTQTLVTFRRPDLLWRHSLHYFKRSASNLKQTLQVIYRNEGEADETGWRNDYLEILFRQMMMSSLMERNEDSRGNQVSYDNVALGDGDYACAGRMLACVLLHGGAVLPVLSHPMISYAVHGRQAATLQTVTDPNARRIIENIMNEEDVSRLSNDVSVLELMRSAGIRMELSPLTKEVIIKDLINHTSWVTKRKAMLDAFWQGAEELGLWTLIQEHPAEFESILCCDCGKEPELNALTLISMLDFDKFGEDGSNQRRQSEDVAQNLVTFLFDCEDGKCEMNNVPIRPGNVLKFITGSSVMPPCGFDRNFPVHFTSEICVPFKSHCGLEITLPIHITDYRQFRDVMCDAVGI